MTSSKSSSVLVAYVPAPHRGYLELFRAYAGGTLWILGPELIAEFPALVRHLPGVEPETVRAMVDALGVFADVRVLSLADLEEVRAAGTLAMPDEDVAHAIADRYFAGQQVSFDPSWRLRWDWGAVQAFQIPPGETVISRDELDQAFMRQAFGVAAQSSDWWRQVGAVLAKDGTVLLAAHNAHQPHEQNPYLYGDPRSNFEPGQYIELSSALHAEVAVIAEAARRGIPTEGCDLYVTTFPCPPCAYACARGGLRSLFYAEGYSRIEGAAALEAKGVQMIRVRLDSPSSA